MKYSKYKIIFAFILVFTIFTLCSGQCVEDRSIIIVGAGLSGFAAARRLLEKGYTNVKILEATNRTGGRVRSVPFSVGKVDLGAQWMHGQTGNIIYQMTIQDPSIKLGSTPFETVDPYFLWSNGTFPNQTPFSRLFAAGYQVIDEIDYITNTQGLSYLQLFNNGYDTKVASMAINPDIKKQMKIELTRDLQAYYAAGDMYDVSAKVNYDESSTSGDQHVTWTTFGFDTFFEVLSRKRPNPALDLNIGSKVFYNKKVTKVTYNTLDACAKVVVTCADGTTYQASHVIYSASLGVLKANHLNTFSPQLPLIMQKEISSRGIGNLGKIFLEFDRVFWVRSGEPYLGIRCMWTNADKAALIGTSREWVLGIDSFYALNAFSKVLEVLIAGDYVRQFEMISDKNKIFEDAKWVLEKCAPYTKPVPTPLNILTTKWLTDENFLGSYSYSSMAEERNNVRTRDLSKPIKNNVNKPILMLVGEHTDVSYPSMAHGAVSSGFRAAEQIRAYYGV